MADNTHAGLLSKDIKLSYCATSSGTFTELLDLQEVPNLGGAAEKVDVTTLADGAYMRINGIKDYGDLDFTFLYSAERYAECIAIEQDCYDNAKSYFWKVTFPDDAVFSFEGQASCATVGAGVNAALQFTLSIALTSDIEYSAN